jgi:CBS domain-containing protein
VTKHRTVREMMTPDPIALPETASVFDAAQRMRDASIGTVVVLDGQTVCGIITDRDIVVRGIAEGLDPRSTTLADLCSRDLTTLSPEDHIGTAVRLMRERAIRRLPVVTRGPAVGILTIGDLAMEEDRESALADVSAAPPNV